MTLSHRTRHTDCYHLGGKRFLLRQGAGISNRQNDEGLWVPESYTLSDVVNEGGNIRSIRTGHWMYVFNKGTTAQGGIAGNEFRVYPIRGNLNVWYSIAPHNPQDLSYKEVSARKAIKMYKDKADVQYAFYTGIDGWKLANLIRPSYDKDTFTQKFNVRLEGGIEKIGRTLVYQGEVVAKLPTPQFTINSAIDESYDIEESFNAGELTLSISGLQGMDLSQGGVFDPTLTPIAITKDTRISEDRPLRGFGQSTNVQLRNLNNFANRGFFLADLTGVSGTIIRNELNIFHWLDAVGSPQGKSITLARCLRLDWEDAGTQTGTEGAEANCTNYKDPNVAWTTPGGDFTLDGSVTHAIGAAGTFDVIDAVAIGQDAIDNRGDIISTLLKFTTEGTAGDDVPVWRSREWTTPSEQPFWETEFEIPSAASITPQYFQRGR